MIPLEYRNLPPEVDGIATVELREEPADDEGGAPSPIIIAGYAAVFERPSQEMMGFTEQVDRDAFTESLRTADVVANWNHNLDWLMARMKSGTLRCKTDDRGLAYDFDALPLEDDPITRRLVALLRRGDVTGSSFAFRTLKDDWVYDEENDTVQRTLLKVDLIDVCPVARPAYLDTDVALRSLAEAVGHPLAEVRSLVERRSLATLFGQPEPDPTIPPEPEVRQDPEPVERPYFFGALG